MINIKSATKANSAATCKIRLLYFLGQHTLKYTKLPTFPGFKECGMNQCLWKTTRTDWSIGQNLWELDEFPLNMWGFFFATLQIPVHFLYMQSRQNVRGERRECLDCVFSGTL